MTTQLTTLMVPDISTPGVPRGHRAITGYSKARVLEIIEALRQERRAAPVFCGVAQRKLDDLIERGFEVCGVMIQKPDTTGTAPPSRGAVSDGGMVIWWHPEAMEKAHITPQPPKAQP